MGDCFIFELASILTFSGANIGVLSMSIVHKRIVGDNQWLMEWIGADGQIAHHTVGDYTWSSGTTIDYPFISFGKLAFVRTNGATVSLVTNIAHMEPMHVAKGTMSYVSVNPLPNGNELAVLHISGGMAIPDKWIVVHMCPGGRLHLLETRRISLRGLHGKYAYDAESKLLYGIFPDKVLLGKDIRHVNIAKCDYGRYTLVAARGGHLLFVVYTEDMPYLAEYDTKTCEDRMIDHFLGCVRRASYISENVIMYKIEDVNQIHSCQWIIYNLADGTRYEIAN